MNKNVANWLTFAEEFLTVIKALIDKECPN
jgi:hypothetical protein